MPAHPAHPAPAGASVEPAGPAVVLAHDYLLVLRGAERVFAQIADMYPGAPVLTLLYDREATEDRFAGHEVSTSPLQRSAPRSTTSGGCCRSTPGPSAGCTRPAATCC